MTFENLHVLVFNLLDNKDINVLLPIQNIFYYFPPQDQMEIFPRVHFRMENVKTNMLGDDKEEINSARLIIDVYDNRPPYLIVDKINSVILNDTEIYANLVTSSPNYDIEDGIHGINLIYELNFNN